jgi:hypothetical protein
VFSPGICWIGLIATDERGIESRYPGLKLEFVVHTRADLELGVLQWRQAWTWLSRSIRSATRSGEGVCTTARSTPSALAMSWY